jgi:hypothetical protein
MPEPETNSTAIAGSSPVHCSPSSGTPETAHALIAILDREGTLFDGNAPKELVNLCRKLERERDYYREQMKIGVVNGTRVATERDRLQDAIRWALGEGEEGFREQCCNEGKYWWRKELRERASSSPENH